MTKCSEKKKAIAKKMTSKSWATPHKGKDFGKAKPVSTSESRSGFSGRDNS